eukprot:Hpha_TRINITY_DN16136_c5_g3::TRINITY_DN16136_c5_g3_i1::g.3395::m.3395
MPPPTEDPDENLSLAIILSIAAGLATMVGGMAVFFPQLQLQRRISEPKTQFAVLALGVILYASFVGIFVIFVKAKDTVHRAVTFYVSSLAGGVMVCIVILVMVCARAVVLYTGWNSFQTKKREVISVVLAFFSAAGSQSEPGFDSLTHWPTISPPEHQVLLPIESCPQHRPTVSPPEHQMGTLPSHTFYPIRSQCPIVRGRHIRLFSANL